MLQNFTLLNENHNKGFPECILPVLWSLFSVRIMPRSTTVNESITDCWCGVRTGAMVKVSRKNATSYRFRYWSIANEIRAIMWKLM